MKHELLVCYPPGTCGNYIMSKCMNHELKDHNEFRIPEAYTPFDDDYINIVDWPKDPYLNFKFLQNDVFKHVKKKNHTNVKSKYVRSHCIPFYSCNIFNLKFEKTILIKFKTLDCIWKSRLLNVIKRFNNENYKNYEKNDLLTEQVDFPYLKKGNDLANMFNHFYNNGNVQTEFLRFFSMLICIDDKKKLNHIYNWYNSDFYKICEEEIKDRSNTFQTIYFNDILNENSIVQKTNIDIIDTVIKWIN